MDALKNFLKDPVKVSRAITTAITVLSILRAVNDLRVSNQND